MQVVKHCTVQEQDKTFKNYEKYFGVLYCLLKKKSDKKKCGVKQEHFNELFHTQNKNFDSEKSVVGGSVALMNTVIQT